MMNNYFNSNKIYRFAQKTRQEIQHFFYREKWLNHRFIFSINSGRCGSNYLSKLLSTAEGAISYHEPQPAMVGDYLMMINKYDYAKTFSKRKFKVTAIKNQVLQFPDSIIYCETNHMFIKTFPDVVIQAFPKIDVIILRRYLPHVLKSCVELGYFSPQKQGWRLWMSSPNAVTAAISCIDLDQNLDQWDLIIAYLIDIEARAKRFQDQYPWVKTHEVRLESFDDFNNVEKLFQDLHLTLTDETKAIYYKKTNVRDEAKKKLNQQTTDLNYCRDRIDQYIQKAHDLNIPIPTTLALNEL